MLLVLLATCLFFSQVIGESACDDKLIDNCVPLLDNFKDKGARISITGANRDTELKGTFLAEDGMKVGFTIRINQESTSEFGKGEAYLEGCEGPQQFKVDGDTLEGSWDVKMDNYKIKLYKDKMLKFDYPFNDECSKKLKEVKWTGLTVGGFGSATLNVDYPADDFERIGYNDEGGKACNYDKSDNLCDVKVLTQFGTKGAELYVSTAKPTDKVTMGMWEASNNDPIVLEISIDKGATEAEKRGAFRFGDCGKGAPLPLKLPFSVETLSGEWVVKINPSNLMIWLNGMQIIAASFVKSPGNCARGLNNGNWVGITFNNIVDNMDIYYYYPKTDITNCQWERRSDNVCKREGEKCMTIYDSYCACGKLESFEALCSAQPNPGMSQHECACPDKCYWQKSPGKCNWNDNENKCKRKIFIDCSCGMDRNCYKVQKPEMGQEYCDDYECMDRGSSSKLMGTSTLFLLVALAYRTAF